MASADHVLPLLYAIWLVLTVARQRGMPLHKVVSRRDLFELLPDWSLFTGTSYMDYRILLRVTLKDGSPSGWAPLEFWGARSASSALWYPGMTARTIARHAIGAMISTKDSAGRHRVIRSVLYRAFLRMLATSALERHAVALQFVVYAYLRYEPSRRPEVVFLSDVHGLQNGLENAV